jgi:putative aldouronate transport system permease protein
MQAKQAIRTVGKNGRVKTVQDKMLDLVVVAMSVVAILLCLLPMLNVAATSLSSELAIINRRVFIWPVDLDLEAYKSVFQDKSMIRALVLTATLTVVSTIFSMIMTILCAYPLSQKKLVGRGLFNTIVILTMYFNAGIIPDYLNIKRLDLLDNFWVMVLPIGISVFNMIILKSFFLGLPDSLQESAELDGASHWTVLVRIFLPLSMPALATIALFYAVGRWNGFQDARIYISSPSLYPIQFKLYQIISNLSSVESSMEGVAIEKVAKEGMKSASIMFATLPILMIYPWLQRYFVAGVTLGAVKG